MRPSIFLGPILISFAAGCADMGYTKGVAAVWRPEKGESLILSGEGGARLVVSPKLQGRTLTTAFGPIDSVGFVCYREIYDAIRKGESRERFNNFGGQDRFWIGPEAGQYGIYFAPGAELDRKNWRVPEGLNVGPWTVLESTPETVRMRRDMGIANYSGVAFQVRAEREVGFLLKSSILKNLGLKGEDIQPGVTFTGSFSDNVLTNAGANPWKKETGLLNIWILGQFIPGEKTVVIAPFKPGDGQPYRDEPYFGKVPADRLKVSGGAILLRADGRAESKFGIPPSRCAGLAGSYDYSRNLLVVVRFDVPSQPTLYANSEWTKQQPEPYAGDLFQAYNSDRKSFPDHRYAFYEMESVSPSLELAPGESVRHRHETYCFQGEYIRMKEIAQKVLGVDLDAVQREMLQKP